MISNMKRYGWVIVSALAALVVCGCSTRSGLLMQVLKR